MENKRGILWWPRRRSVVFDVGLAVGFAVADLLIVALDEPHPFLPVPILATLNAIVALLLVVRRRFPVGVAAASAIGGIGGIGGLAVVVAYYTLAAYGRSRRVTWLLTAIAIAGILVQPDAPDTADMPLWGKGVTALAVVLPPVLLGLYTGARNELLTSLREKAERLEREQHLQAERARSDERARIAREMHDVVANRVSVMVVHSGALRASVRRDPERAAEIADVIGMMGRQALEELRQVIGVLRLGEDAPPPVVPGLEDIEDLIQQSCATGTPITFNADKELGPPEVARTVYRVVQEALTNVHKHGRGASTRVELRRLPEEIEVLVENDPPNGQPDYELPSGGYGLAGLRERVTALGGTFEAGVSAGGGFLVHARITLPES